MKHQHLTWYLLVDGTHADPNDVAPGDDGVLRHKNGLAVALHENGAPMSIGVGAVENKNVEAAEAGEEAAAAAQQEAAAEAEPSDVIEGGAVQTEIDPASGQPAETVPEVKEVVAPKPAKKLGTDRAMKPAKPKTYKTR